MNFLKRAWLSVSRRKGKSALLFAIVFILGNVIAGAISIQQSTKNVENKIKSDMGATATISLDYEALTKAGESDPNIFETIVSLTPEQIEAIGNLSYVKYYDYSTQASIGSDALKNYIPDKIKEQMGGAEDPFSKYYGFSLKGVQFNKIIQMEEGAITLEEGRVFTEDEIAKNADVGLISKKTAETNQIKVGDTIVLSSYTLDYGTSGNASEVKPLSKKDYAVEVIGIFGTPAQAPKKDSDKNDTNSGGLTQDEWTKAYQEQSTMNTIYVPNGFVRTINAENMAQRATEDPEMDLSKIQDYYTPIYVLNKPEDVDYFKEEAQAMLPEYYVVKASSDAYDTIAAPVQSMSKMAGYVLIVAIIATIMIITLVVLLFLRDRKHELGIYLSFGEAKGKVVGQVLAEVFMIAFVAISLSVFSGNMIAKGLSGSLIQNQIENQASQNGGSITYDLSMIEFNQNDYTQEDVVAAYEVSLTPGYIAAMYSVGLGTVLVATLVPMIYIVRLNPKKIMM